MTAKSPANIEMLKENVQRKFKELRGALHMREKLLLRQLDVVAATSQQQLGRHKNNSNNNSDNSNVNDVKEIKFLIEQEEELLASIRCFGRFQFDNMNLALQDVYMKHEDYITPANDHETMYKCLTSQDGDIIYNLSDDLEDEQPETIVVDFSKNKSLIEHNTKHMNESIINITLKEAKELIRKAKVKRDSAIPPLNLEELDDELESSIAEAVSCLKHESPANTKSSQTCLDLKKGKKNRFKPKITINNCNGTINLRNISSLTINCATEDAVTAEIPVKCDTTTTEKQPECAVDSSTQQTLDSAKSHKTKTAPHQAAASAASITLVESSSTTGNTTPTTTASSSNYSSNASSRSQSKKQKNSKKQSKNISSTSGTSSSTVTTPQLATTSSNTNAARQYPYEIITDDLNDEEEHAVTCDFYNRLLNEIKNTLKEKTKRTYVDNAHHTIVSGSSTSNATVNTAQTSNSAAAAAATPDTTTYRDANSNASYTNSNNYTCTGTNSNLTSLTEQQQQPNKRLILKNFENLKIILEANSDEETFHPVQIEQWLAEIIAETDLEPMQNSDILEHSKINNESI